MDFRKETCLSRESSLNGFNSPARSVADFRLALEPGVGLRVTGRKPSRCFRLLASIHVKKVPRKCGKDAGVITWGLPRVQAGFPLAKRACRVVLNPKAGQGGASRGHAAPLRMLDMPFNSTFKDRYRRLTHPRGEARTDWVGPSCMALLGLVGVIFIYSAQHYSGGGQWAMQLAWLGAGALAYVLVSLFNYKIYLNYAHIFYGVCVLLLIAVISPLGHSRFGSQRWLDFGPVSLQPSEPAKIGTLIMVAGILARSEMGSIRDSLRTLGLVGAISIVPIILIFLQPDLGSSLVYPPMVFALLYMSNLSRRFFITCFAVFLLLVSVVGLDVWRYQRFLEENNLSALRDQGAYDPHSFVPLHDYQRNRILAFVAPEVVDPRGVGVSWNLRQSLIAVGSGGFWGKGHLNSTQAKLGYLPQSVATNDFIFSVIAEEKGFLGGLLVIGLYTLLIGNSLRIAGLARDRFGTLLCVGVAVLLMVHVMVNIGMTIGLMPITGVPLPFISYGGSFVVSCCVLQGMVQSVYRFRKDLC